MGVFTNDAVATGPLVRASARAVLDGYVRHYGAAPVPDGAMEDPGPLVLAALLSRFDGPAEQAATGATEVWLRRCGFPGPYVLGLFDGGLAGHLLALATGADTWPGMRMLALRNRDRVAAAASIVPWRPGGVGWSDYDVVAGPAGTLLSLAVDPACRAEECTPVVERLVSLCDADDLGRLRVAEYRDDPVRGFNYGRVNTGVGHGAAGIALGLVAAADIGALPGSGRAALRRIGRWLAAQSFVDSRGVRTWAPVGRDNPPVSADGVGVARIKGASRRQGWCHGTPGTAWALWETARVLGDECLRGVAVEAMDSFITAYDEDFYLADAYPDKVGVCHGAAGLLLILDAFDRHADLPAAGSLGERCADFLAARLERVVAGTVTDHTLLTGSTGVLAALLTYWYAGRSWLRGLGLR
jgi:lantibiotic biosynthesis protein